MQMPVQINGNVIPVLRGTATAGLRTLSTSSAQSAAFTEDTMVIFNPDVDCFIKVAADPTAATDGTSDRLFGGFPSLPYLVRTGEKIAGIVASGTGNLYWSVVGE
jgi:hypothetical protein